MHTIYKTTLAVLFFSSHFLIAQSNFQSGFVIKNNGDTLKGKIKYIGDVYLGKTCTFKDTSETIIDFNPSDIKAYRFTDDRYFVSREITFGKEKTKETVFLEYLVNGKANVYYYKRNNNETRYFIEKDTSGLVELVYEEGYKYKDDKTFFYKTTEHKLILKQFMSDVPSLNEKIEELKQPEHNQLIRLASKYHKSVCPDSNCTVYKKKIKNTIWLGLSSGVSIYSFVYLKQQLYLTGTNINLTAHIQITNSNRFFIRTGLNVYSYKPFERIFSIISIPAHIEYVKPFGKLRPMASIGISLAFPIAGIDYLLDKDKKIIPVPFSANNVIFNDYFTFITSARVGLEYHIIHKLAIGFAINAGYEGIIGPKRFELLELLPFWVFNAELGIKYRIR